jgi:pyrimidine operon attenuation protein / uracil phosphoribosyltransferase
MTARSMMDSEQIRRTITRLGHEIVERQGGTDGLVLIGIQRRGVVLAQRLAEAIAASERVRLPVGALDISLYRDDLSELANYPIVRPTELPFDITDRTVVLIDDVLFTGRTVRAAMDALIDFGRPRAVRLAVLVDRGHRELPIRADHVGRNLPTARAERVNVHVQELDGIDEVELGSPATTLAAVAYDVHQCQRPGFYGFIAPRTSATPSRIG